MRLFIDWRAVLAAFVTIIAWCLILGRPVQQTTVTYGAMPQQDCICPKGDDCDCMIPPALDDCVLHQTDGIDALGAIFMKLSPSEVAAVTEYIKQHMPPDEQEGDEEAL